MKCVWREEPCDRTDIQARGLCGRHYWNARYRRLIDDYPLQPQPPSKPLHGPPVPQQMGFEQMRDAGLLLCHCPHPDGIPNSECNQCRRPILTAERIAYLRARRRLDEAAS